MPQVVQVDIRHVDVADAEGQQLAEAQMSPEGAIDEVEGLIAARRPARRVDPQS